MAALTPETFRMAAIIAAVLGLALFIWAWRGDRPRGRRRCPSCWYDMAGVPSLRCPECGSQARTERKLARTRRRWSVLALALVIAAAPTTWAAVRNGWRSLVPNTLAILALPWTDSAAPARLIQSRVTSGGGCIIMHPQQTLRPWQWDLLLTRSLRRVQSPGPTTTRLIALDLAGVAQRYAADPDRCIPALFNVIGDPDKNIRNQALQEIKSSGPLPAAALGTLLAAVDSADVCTRSYSIEAIGHIRPFPKPAIPRLIALLDDQEQLVRHDAIVALSEGRAASADATTRLLRIAAEDPIDYVRCAAMESLGRIRAADAVDFLIDQLRNPNWSFRSSAAEALGRIGPDAARAIPALLATVRGRIPAPTKNGTDEEEETDEQRRHNADLATQLIKRDAIDALGRIGAEPSQVIPVIRRELVDLDHMTRYGAVVALGRFGPRAQEAIPDLVASAGDPEWTVRREAATALGRVGSLDGVPTLRALLVDKTPAVQTTAITALFTLGAQDEATIEALRVTLRSGDQFPLRWIAAVYPEPSGIPPSLLDVLRTEMTSGHPIGSVTAAGVLQILEPANTAAARVVRSAARSSDPARRETARSMRDVSMWMQQME